jgi:hypothetical protein
MDFLIAGYTSCNFCVKGFEDFANILAYYRIFFAFSSSLPMFTDQARKSKGSLGASRQTNSAPSRSGFANVIVNCNIIAKIPQRA